MKYSGSQADSRDVHRTMYSPECSCFEVPGVRLTEGIMLMLAVVGGGGGGGGGEEGGGVNVLEYNDGKTEVGT